MIPTPNYVWPAMPPPDMDDDEREFFASAQREAERVQLATPGLHWIDPAPVWLESDWWTNHLFYLAADRADRNEVAVALRLKLPGGLPEDELRLTARFQRDRSRAAGDDDEFLQWSATSIALRVTVRTDDGLRRHHLGTIEHTLTEMGQAFITGLPADVAERVATLMREINDCTPCNVPDPQGGGLQPYLKSLNWFRADGAHCIVCHRPLRDEVSKVIGIGPDCAAGLGVPHTLGEAGRVLRGKP